MTVDKVTHRPSQLTHMHHYNLRNQGWPTEFTCTWRENAANVRQDDPVPFTKEVINVYPSNADIIYAAKASSANRHRGVGSYSPFELRKGVFGNTPAPRGRYILPAFDRNRSLISGIPGLYNPARDRDTFRPTAVEFYAGRIFYLKPNGEVLYSQVIDLDVNFKAERCYQDADPTAEDINELVATDGGVIYIHDMGEGLTLKAVGNELLVFADNGVWSISGSEQSGFRATDHRVRRVTNIGVAGARTVIAAENNAMYWGKGGIYLVAPDEISGDFQAQNITEQTIQEFYNDIGATSRRHATGFYDDRSRKILWFYNDDPSYDGIEFKNKYNKALIFDLVLGSFYKYSMELEEGFPFVADMFQKESTGTELVEKNVVLTSTYPLGDFVTTWDTTLGGGYSTVALPFTQEGTYDCIIHWGDGSVEHVTTGGLTTHTYDEPGIYTVRIGGVCTDWSPMRSPLHTHGMSDRLISVDQWGSIEWGSNLMGFMANTNNLQINATDSPDFSNVTDFSFGFYSSGATDMLKADYSNVENIEQAWEWSSVTSMPSGLDFSSVITATRAWQHSALEGPVSIVLPLATNVQAMFAETNVTSITVTATSTGVAWHRVGADCPNLTTFVGNFGPSANTGGFDGGPPHAAHALFNSPNLSSVTANSHDGWMSIASKNLSALAINNFFHSLANPSRGGTFPNIVLWIGDNPGTYTADLTIATNKGYNVQTSGDEVWGS